MKLTHLTLIYIFLLVVSLVIVDLQARTLGAMTFQREVYNHNFDQAAESALDGAVTYEGYGDQVEIDPQQLMEDYFSQLYFDMDIHTEEGKTRLRSYIPLMIILEWDGYCRVDPLTETVEEKTPYPEDRQERAEALRLVVEKALQDRMGSLDSPTISFPSIPEEDWYQDIESPGLITVFMGLPMGIGTITYSRVVISGGRIRKAGEG